VASVVIDQFGQFLLGYAPAGEDGVFDGTRHSGSLKLSQFVSNTELSQYPEQMQIDLSAMFE